MNVSRLVGLSYDLAFISADIFVVTRRIYLTVNNPSNTVRIS